MICPICQTPNLDQARFCQNCGAALEASRPSEGERKRVAVLFADVVGSTAMAERLDPEDVVEIMNGAFDLMTTAVTRYEGTVARLMGDAILALFGAPLSHEDDAERAVRAGLEIRDAAHAYGQKVERRHGVSFGVRVGIDTGLVVVGEVGSAGGTEYTAMGDTPNVAARLQAAAEPGAVLISKATYRLARYAIDVEPQGALSVKGRSQPVDTYRVVQAKATPGTGRGLEGVHSPLVGREAEYERIRAEVEALREGRGGFVAVLGEAGLGKSRLVTEVHQETSSDRVRWLEGRALSYGQALSYYPWRQVLRQALGVQESDAPPDVRARLQEVVAANGLSGDDLPFFETILAVESEKSLQALSALEGSAVVERLAQAVQTYLSSLARRTPTVVVFDDLHWADQASLELLGHLAQSASTDSILFLCVLRPDKFAPSWRMLERTRDALGERYREISLGPLDAARTRELLDNLLHVEDLPKATRAVILQKAEGNPFFLEEVLRSLIDCGQIVREDGHWRATRDIRDVTIPDTLAGVLSARIDRLPEHTKRVAQTAAVLGRIFAHEVLTDVCRRAPDHEQILDVSPHLETLTYEELVRERARRPLHEYIFKHALTQETAYDLLLVRRRKELHRLAGEALERFHRERSDEMAPIVALHYWMGESWERAARHSRHAGARARKLYALNDALAHFQRALDALDRLPTPPLEDKIDATLEWAGVAVMLRLHEQPERRDELIGRLDAALDAARALGDDRRTARVLVEKGNALTLSGRPGTAFPLLLEASDLASALGDDHLFLLPFFATTELLVNQDPRRAVDQIQEVIELAQKHHNRGIEAHATAIKASAHARLGEADAARQTIERALELAPSSNSVIKEADVNIVAGSVYYDLGEVERGIEYSARGAELAHSVNGIECACAGYAFTGLGNLHAARPQQALEDFGRALEVGEGVETEMDTQMEVMLNQIQAWKAIAHYQDGDPAALARIEATLDNALRAGDDFGAAFIRKALGDVHLQRGELAQATDYLGAALAYYRHQGMRPYVARTLQSMALLHDREGHVAEAAEVRTEAETFMQALPPAVAAPPPTLHGEARHPGR